MNGLSTPTNGSHYLYNKLVWVDDFNGAAIDESSWSFETGGHGWGNNELQNYTDRHENARLEKGRLVIEAHEESYGGNNYTSAKLVTKYKRSFEYGRIETRIKLPYGKGIWPALWMLGSTIDIEGWPKCGEIDVIELVGGGEGMDDVVHGTIHYDDDGHQQSGGVYKLDSGNFSEDYHIISTEWNSSVINWYCDGYKYFTTAVTSSMLECINKPQYILLNLAVGGNWPGSPDSTTVFPQSMYVDWIRVFQ